MSDMVDSELHHSKSLNLIQKNISCQKVLLGMQFVSDEVVFDLNDSLRVSASQKVIDDYDSMKEYCVEKENYYSSKIKKNISCENIKLGKEAIISGLVEDFVIEVYYNNYSKCDFWDCMKKTGSTQFLISQRARDYWNSLLKKIILFCLVLLICFCWR